MLAICALLNAIGELKELPHYSHRDYVDIVKALVRETGDRELVRLFASAERLHANFYHAFLSRPSFEAHREDTLRLEARGQAQGAPGRGRRWPLSPSGRDLGCPLYEILYPIGWYDAARGVGVAVHGYAEAARGLLQQANSRGHPARVYLGPEGLWRSHGHLHEVALKAAQAWHLRLHVHEAYHKHVRPDEPPLVREVGAEGAYHLGAHAPIGIASIEPLDAAGPP
ncbi:hypothetical protein DRO60_04090 [Candidatus Bathyarchaeota archaeon]|nr:MAG: hypothetical protein DRO60_04090 [Candidatus Bathyarchaeota archaeon]